jgi:ESAT-6 family protein
VSNPGGELKVDPGVLAGTCSALSAAAEHLLSQLETLDGSVESMLSEWQGASGGSYSNAWGLWLRGADDVEKGLAIMADLLGQAGKAYQEQDTAAGTSLGDVHG